jgi:photosystem II stability/assembly factor-like uncharacterized protein
MKKFLQPLISIVTIIFILSYPFISNSALIQLSSNSGEVRDLLLTDDHTIFAATRGGGIYKSNDTGSSWSRSSGLNERYIWRLAGHPSNPQLIYAATNKGLYKSINGGTSWVQKTFDFVGAIAISPFNQDHLLIGVPGAGIYRSNDGGNSFSLSNSGLDSVDVSAIAFDPMASGIVYAGLNSDETGGWGGVFKSIDGGTTWVNWNNPGNNGPIPHKFITALVVDNQGTIHAGTYDPVSSRGGLYRQNGMGGWDSGVEVYGVETIIIDKNAPNRIWAGTASVGPAVSNDYGVTWRQGVDPQIYPQVYSAVYSLLTFPGTQGKVLAGIKGLGLYQTLNGNSTWPDWSKTGQDLKADRARAFVAYPPVNATTFYMGLAGGGVMRSTDNGLNWSDFSSGLKTSVEINLTISQLAISHTDPTLIYATADGRGLFRWNGTNWINVAETGLPPNAFITPTGLAVDAVDDRIVFYSIFDAGYGVYRRNSTGTWALVRPGPFSGQGASKIVMSPTNHLNVFALMFDELPYRSTNGGTLGTWTQVNAAHVGFMRLMFYAIAENPSDANLLLASTNKGLFKSDDGGVNWVRVDSVSGLGNTVLTDLVFSPTVNGRVWAVDRGGGYYCSNDYGTTWITRTDPLLGSPIVGLQWLDGALYLITDGSGVLKDSTPTCP